MDRRQLLISASTFVLLAGCAGQTSGQVAQQVVSDVQLLASGLTGALPGLAAAGVDPGVVTSVGGYVSKISSLASSVSTSLTATQALPVIQQIGGVLQQILAVAGPALPPPWGTAILAAEVLLPVIETGVGMVANATKAPAAAAMTPDQARAALAKLAAR